MVDNMVENIQNVLKRLSNKKIAEHSLRFFKTGKGEYGEGDTFLGIRVPVLRQLAKKYKDISVNEAFCLLNSNFHEERLLSLFILIQLYKKSDSQQKEEIYERYLSNTPLINNWDLVDSSAEHIVGTHLWDRPRSSIYELAESKSLWNRRISIMSTFYFIKHNDFDDTFNISEILLHDKEDLIHKAVGWMIREVCKRNLSIGESFLKKHYKTMPRTMLRYAIEKFDNEKRKSYLNSK